ncbi:N-acetylmuramoyl-L-alanine amidase [Haematobacter massiliensis]|mgnify:CR=1 FL=1|uniref:N-acetylmuramoyl-L-alanine amidase n=1 Tax=Haematobacter massiliensis TaxID=195105 RepID=A0A086YCH5_9RHOB|nr:N-acetylmuramoyl-L-alanine amidase [Haematobacter massiliensis]KFI31975.1 N-acetylmuramoyl-L-alanine amidase [Haematobacter massiliensis]OWJ72586.1 N-acetylmuramoyl-L-alanine amidase [Haematobacter massiliensis]OWJ87925.1 N-acetylmuramoyl-L-alanine amidase [Haematobacter massiliensis]QBJ24364.1 N-acetylmuramoyl-L-alanine amidase [Haematobacter massiliensis]
MHHPLIRALAALILLFCLPTLPLAAAPAHIDPGRSHAQAGWWELRLALALDRAVPYRLTLRADPPRLVVELRDADLSTFDPRILVGSGLQDARVERAGNRWARLVLTLDRPRMVTEALLSPADPVLRLRLSPVRAEVFAAAVGAETGEPTQTAPPSRLTRAAYVMLDPGHGGIDPGAEHGGTNEARLMLLFAVELREVLEAAGFTVSLTREEDVFVPLETRISRAHLAGADVFLSLHADALAEGQASGATVYTLSSSASDRASAALAERHDRTDILAGVNLSGHDDRIAQVLVDLARTDTGPRSEQLADALVAAIGSGAGPLYKTPRRAAGFSVLKSPSIPSVLIELGYLSTPADFARIANPAWRAQMAASIAAGLSVWQQDDAAAAVLRRK